MIGIYMIENIDNHKKYIGQTKNLDFRWIHHRCDLNGNIHTNSDLQNDWNIYGEEKFIFSILEETSIEKLNAQEQYWISYYDSFNNGYNKCEGGAGCLGYKHSEEDINKMRRIQNPDIVLQFDKNFNLLKRWCGGYSNICKELRYTKECIKIRCTHKIKEMSLYKNCYWVLEKEYTHKDFTWEKYLKNIKIVDGKKSSITNKRKIIQYSLDRKVINIWESVADIRKVYGNTSSVSSVLNHSRGKKSAYGYIWAYEDYDFSDGYFDKKENKASKNRKRKVAKINPITHKTIQIYNSLKDAANDLLKPNATSCICVAAKNYPNKTSYNYLWKYI